MESMVQRMSNAPAAIELTKEPNPASGSHRFKNLTSVVLYTYLCWCWCCGVGVVFVGVGLGWGWCLWGAVGVGLESSNQ
jgi:hypothetical protein